MRKRYMQEQIDEVVTLYNQGMSPTAISEWTGINRDTVNTFIHRSKHPLEVKQPPKPKEKRPAKCREQSISEKLKILAIKRQRAQQRIDTAKPGDKITVYYPGSKGYIPVTGEVQTKYPDKLLIRDGKGRPQMITYADMLTYKVVTG